MIDDLDAGQVTPDEDGLLEYVLSNFVRPVLYALTGAGLWRPDQALTEFEVRFLDDGEASIQLNGSDTAWSRARSVRDLAEGAAVEHSDLVTSQLAHAPASARYITGTLSDAGWRLEFRFGGSEGKAQLHLQAADEFLASAHDDLAARRPRAAFSAAFHAAEHYAKAELLHYSLTAVHLDSSKKHSAVRSTYTVWARLGNSDERFAEALNKLDRERGRATYLDGQWTTDHELTDMIATLDEMRLWVTRVVEGRGPKVIHAISTRAIQAGTMVGPGDLSLWPQRPPAP